METQYPSPDGRYIFHIDPWEARMSLWVESPKLIDTQSGQAIFSFKDANWSLDGADWLDGDRVRIFLRKYPGDHQPSGVEADLDCQQKQASLMGGPPMSLHALEAALDALLVHRP